MDIAPLDWLILAVLILSMAVGAWRGLVYEVLAVLGWVAAFILAPMFAGLVGDLLPLGTSGESLRYAAGFGLVFIVALFASGFVSWLASKGISKIGLRPVDRVLGAGFGVVRGMLILMAVVTVLQMTPLKNGTWQQESMGYSMLDTSLKKLKPVLPPKLGQYITLNVGKLVCVES